MSLAHKGYIVSEETKEKLRMMKPSLETKKKISINTKKAMKNKEIRKKISLANKERLKDKTNHPMYGKKHSKETKDKMKLKRKNRVFPIKDTSIEVKIQNFLKELGIEFLTHKYMNIQHGYQCDIFIPKQKGISQKTIIECFGDYWHKIPYGNPVDSLRCQELREQGYRVLVFWEREIKAMEVNDLRNEFSPKQR